MDSSAENGRRIISGSEDDDDNVRLTGPRVVVVPKTPFFTLEPAVFFLFGAYSLLGKRIYFKNFK